MLLDYGREDVDSPTGSNLTLASETLYSHIISENFWKEAALVHIDNSGLRSGQLGPQFRQLLPLIQLRRAGILRRLSSLSPYALPR